MTKDLDELIADGFYFTITSRDDKCELAHELMYYGECHLSYYMTGSHQEGLRVCTSFVKDNQYDLSLKNG